MIHTFTDNYIGQATGKKEKHIRVYEEIFRNEYVVLLRHKETHHFIEDVETVSLEREKSRDACSLVTPAYIDGRHEHQKASDSCPSQT